MYRDILDDSVPNRNDGESDFAWGKRVGFADVIIQEHDLRHYSAEFQKGYREGKDEIEGLCEDVTEGRCFGGR